MPTDTSNILPCPNCKSRPRVTGVSGGLPVKIRCSNKKCELSHESAGVTFWQGIRRDDVLTPAFEQFKESLAIKDDEIKLLRANSLTVPAQKLLAEAEVFWNTNWVVAGIDRSTVNFLNKIAGLARQYRESKK